MNKQLFRDIVSPYSMTSIERIDCLYDSLEYLRNKNIEGDYIECGVWKGGNILGILKYLQHYDKQNSNVWLFDTFSGMTSPTEVDIAHGTGIKASDILEDVMCRASLSEVQSLLSQTNYSAENLHYIVGDVCQTLVQQQNIPEKISLLRLDTDWYASTKMELEKLWPNLQVGGVCIVDDYGHWRGCRKAVDEFFQTKNEEIVVNKIDYTGLHIIKLK